MPFENGRTNTKVFNTAVVTGAKKCLVDLDAAGFLSRNYIVNEVRFRYNRAYFGKIEGVLSCVNSIRIAVIYSF